MADEINTGWVKPPTQITGLDHLGIQAPCIDIYGKLLPGITNVTDRARYYSFYPWLFWAFNKRGWNDKDTFIERFRQADCLFSLIAIRHQSLHSNDDVNHAGAVVGKDTLLPALVAAENKNTTLRLTDYSHQRDGDPTRYFRSELGGFSQYYYGALRDLHLFQGDSYSNASLTRQVGEKVAIAFDKGVLGERFLDELIENDVSIRTLDELSAFCPCNLSASECELGALTDLFSYGVEPFDKTINAEISAMDAKARSRTMAFQVLLAQHCQAHEVNFSLQQFRALAYTGIGYDQQPLKLTSGLTECAQGWQVYVRNELLSLSLQGIFHAVLRAKELTQAHFKSTGELSSWFWHEYVKDELFNTNSTQSLKDYISESYTLMPSFSDWVSEDHESMRIVKIEALTRKRLASKIEIITLLKHCLFSLAALVSRESNQKGYDGMSFAPGYLEERYPFNIESVQQLLAGKLAPKNVINALSQFTHQCCLENHTRVALRKLRQQGNNTFRFEISELGLVINGIPPASFTSPRFHQSIQIMTDLGLLTKHKNNAIPTSQAAAFIEEVS
ncbi:hypothetical protein [Thalassotalea sp. ND16A]|uniref:hypothetical protein n=1 Tax=Thalassotalea sp. ND16A TaxID=1535422 RepID=UPI00051A2113|nr:hypothetical protein [Thalassotalea sp. ND16A]KGJ99886.1 hypothetical protein ND16A_3674 [Thalassotalea sp. ND16A]